MAGHRRVTASEDNETQQEVAPWPRCSPYSAEGLLSGTSGWDGGGEGVASASSSWAAGEAGTEACGPGLCPYVHTCLTHETTVMECGDSRVCTRTRSLKMEVLGHLTWACGASHAELPVARFPSCPKPASPWAGHLEDHVP